MLGRVTSRLRGGGLGFDAALTSLFGLGVFGLSALTGPLLARALGTEARGDLASVLVPTQVLSFVLLWGLPHASAFYVTKVSRRTLVMTAWVVMLTINLPLMLIGALFVPAYLSGHDPVTVPALYFFLGQVLIFLPMITTLDCLRGEGRTVPYNLFRALPFLLNAVTVVVLFVLDELTLESALVSQFAANAIAWVAVFLYARTWPGPGFDRTAFRAQLDYGWRAAIGMMSNMVVGKFDQFLLVPLVDPELLGLYVVAATGASLTAPIGQGVGLALFPHARGAADRGRADAQTRTALLWTAGVTGATVLIVGLAAPWVIPLLFGSEFEGAVLPMLILLPGQVFMDLGIVQASRLEADGRPGAASRALFVASVVTIVGVLALVPTFGIEGAAVVTSISQATFFGLATLYRRRSGDSIERGGLGDDDDGDDGQVPPRGGPAAPGVGAIDQVDELVGVGAGAGAAGGSATVGRGGMPPPAAMVERGPLEPGSVAVDLTPDSVAEAIRAAHDGVVHADPDRPLTVQGGPGTGRNLVARRRARWVASIPAEPAVLQQDRPVLLVGPSDRYVRSCKGRTSTEGLWVSTVDDLAASRLPLEELGRLDWRRDADGLAERTKARPVMARVVAACVWSRARPVGLHVAVDGLDVQLDDTEVEGLLVAARRSARAYEPARRHLRQALEVRLLEECRSAADRDRSGRHDPRVVAEEVGRLAREHAGRVLPDVSAIGCVRGLLTDPDQLARTGRGLITPAAQQALLAAGAPGGAWTRADLPLLDEALWLVYGPDRCARHAVVDEAQVLSPMQWRVVTRRVPSGSLTVLGDLAQGVRSWSPGSWDEIADWAGLEQPEHTELRFDYRTPRPIARFAERLASPPSTLVSGPVHTRDGAQPQLVRLKAKLPFVSLRRRLTEVLEAIPPGPVAVIAPPDLVGMVADIATHVVDHPVDVLDAREAIGLEYRTVVVVEPMALAVGEPGERLLYVALTRALEHLVVLSSTEISLRHH